METFSRLLAICAGNSLVTSELWPVNSPHKGQWRAALMFSLICTWISAWVNNMPPCSLWRHYDVFGCHCCSIWFIWLPEDWLTYLGYVWAEHNNLIWGLSLHNMIWCCHKHFSQWQCSFQMKAALPLAERLVCNSIVLHEWRIWYGPQEKSAKETPML